MTMTTQLRRLWQAPGFALGLLLTVALVVLVNASAFAAWWALLYKPTVVTDEQRWVELRIDLRDIDFQVGLSPSLYAAVQAAEHSFEAAIGAVEMGQPALDEQARPWHVQRINADFARSLGISAARGTAFGLAPEAAQENDLLLTDRAWRERFDADPQVLGRVLRIGTRTYRVVGVMPVGFAWPDASVQAWTPWLPTASEREQDAQGGFGQFHVWARLAPGVDLQQAQHILAQLLSGSGNAFLSSNPDKVRAQVRPWRDRFSAGHLPALLLLQAAAVLLLLVAAANLSALTLDRLWSDRRDHAIRQALGASAAQLLRLVLADLLLPTMLGAALGLALTPFALELLQSRGLLPAALPMAVGGDWPTVVLALLAALLAISVAVTAAALVMRRFARAGSLNQRTPIAGLGRAQALALIAQIALTTALAGGSGLLLRSAAKLAAEPRGFDPTGVLLTQIELPAETAGAAAANTSAQLQAAIAAIPGVEAVTITDMPPFGGAEFILSVLPPGVDQAIEVRAPSVGAGYFAALRMPLLAGRDFSADELRNGDAVIVDENFQRRWMAPGAMLDSSLRIVDEQTPGRSKRIVGVVPASKHKSLFETGERAAVYSPLAAGSTVLFLVSRTALDPQALAQQVRSLVVRHAPDATLMVNIPLAEAVARTQQSRNALLESVSLFGLATLLLAALGLYTVLNAAVNRRRSEFGVRMALGCAPGRILRLVLRQGAVLICIGLALGLLLGLSTAGLLTDYLHQLAPTDHYTWLAACSAVAMVGLLACCWPALRATQVSPRVALDVAPKLHH